MAIDPRLEEFLASEELYHDGTVIVEEGSVGNWVYVILDGSAKVKKETSKGPLTLDILKEGDIFGEIEFLEGIPRPRSTSLVASGEVWVAVLDVDRLLMDYEQVPSKLRVLIRSLMAKYKETTSKLCAMVEAGSVR
jgi:CRP/FNR family cyclic AMP-dependent transcriptional regulator